MHEQPHLQICTIIVRAMHDVRTCVDCCTNHFICQASRSCISLCTKPQHGFRFRAICRTPARCWGGSCDATRLAACLGVHSNGCIALLKAARAAGGSPVKACLALAPALDLPKAMHKFHYWYNMYFLMRLKKVFLRLNEAMLRHHPAYDRCMNASTFEEYIQVRRGGGGGGQAQGSA